MTGTGLRVRVLGPLHVETIDGPLLISAPKQRALLAILALHRGHSVAVEQLMETLWGDDPPRSANKTLQTYISGLRRTLPAKTLQTVPGGYALALAPGGLDADVFEEGFRSARRAREAGEGSAAKEFLEDALRLWRGPALGELARELRGVTEGQRLDELRRVAVEDLHGIRMEAGGDSELVADLKAAVSEEPLRERRWAQLMTSLYRDGRQADALRVYQRLQELLDAELGIEPSSELVLLERAILLHDPALSVVDSEPKRRGSGHGYAAVATSGENVPALKQIEPMETQFSLVDRRLIVGRHDGCDVHLNLDMRVSRHHAEIEARDGEWILRDLRSRNGTLLNGERVTESPLRSGDEIRIGESVFHFIIERDPMATMTGTWAPGTAL